MSSAISVCDTDPALKEEIRKFRFRQKQTSAALIMKVDSEKQMVCLDEMLEDIDVEELKDSLPDHQPRYILYNYKLTHDDGRQSYPMVFIFSTPRDCKPELQMMYAGTKTAIVQEAEMTKVMDIRELDDLTEEWLDEKLKK